MEKEGREKFSKHSYGTILYIKNDVTASGGNEQ